MKNYKKIHLWDFPPTLTFVRINNRPRYAIIEKFIRYFGNEPSAVDFLNKSSTKYGIRRKYSRGILYSWKKGSVSYKGKSITKNIPLWAAIEISKIASDTNSKNNDLMKLISDNVNYYCSAGGANRIYKPKLPIAITPEFTSLIFHFCGDGHLSLKPSVSSSYRQLNEKTLKIIYKKLKNCFGEFRLSLNDGKLYIPKIITEIYAHYFCITENKWYNSRIPQKIFNSPKDFLLAGLVSFLIDEANIGEVIEVYSKNYELLNDIRCIAVKCGYDCKVIKEKYAFGICDCYRFLISSNSYLKMHEDILKLEEEFPLCGLAHKTKKFNLLVRRKLCNSKKSNDGITKNRILKLLMIKPRTISTLVEILNIGPSSVREHLWKLEREEKIIRKGKIGRQMLFGIK